MHSTLRFSSESARRSSSGTVMFAALAVVVTVTMLVAGLMQLSTSMTRQQIVSVDNKRAFYIAEAGLSEAIYGLHLNKTGAVGTSALPARFGDGYFWVEAEDQGNGRVKLDSTGMAGAGRFALAVTVERSAAKVGSLGIFAMSGLSIDRGTYIDGYNSILGTYAQQEAPAKPSGLFGGMGNLGKLQGAPPATSVLAKVGANGEVSITGTQLEPTIIEGDVTPGPTSSVLASGSVTIQGATTPRDQPIELPAIEVPVGFPSQGSLAVAANTTQALPQGQGSYGSIFVSSGARLELLGPLELTAGELRVEAGGELHLNASSGPIDLFVTQRLWIAEGATISSVETPSTETSLLVSASEWSDRNGDLLPDPPADLRATGQFFGTIYAPHSPLTIVSGFEVFGGVIAEQLTIENTAKLHFDFALTTDIGEDVDAPTMLSWKIVELPDNQFVKHKHDPKGLFESLGILTPKAALAHDVVLFHIAYLDFNDKVYVWHGLESSFDRSKIKLEIASYTDGEPIPFLWPIGALAAKVK